VDFIFNINNAPEPVNNNKDIEQILEDIEAHFEDWNNFYNLYQMFAPPPTENAKQIQQWFKELQASFYNIISNYNNKINKFADIQEIKEDEVQDVVTSALSKAGIKIKPKEKEKKPNANEMMWG
tara:strand:+ start:590 stop:961 length:372 start_codon:yes stop_codon:yes gene_type:complete